ncbi:bifunctional nuclease family protein [Tsukamurella ocularis]|uniref:bifunctional nuclease family protein n=1 Tax=Tsukamurella ocularis TaxID=1970234 RepID=UPI002166E4D0|nr:bifunctional nuclease family protein [Tsukamurella ocularis]MCS3779589.1 bifunctional DNase/RNase [Tsukamurella ocularis]MCS3789011.1 bifunctional DNase/RNase [Tsukamurella ocularis]MCS3850221.1 bifunctional DNase/RNase [Tsukamurella ocularis]
MIEMTVAGIRMDPPQNDPVLLLREVSGLRYLPIWIGQGEATAIAIKLQGVEPRRPLTHDLIVDLLETLGRSVTEVRITGLQEGTYFADLVLDGDQTVSARPSDSIAMAVRLEVPIFAEEEVLAEAGLLLPDEEVATEASESGEEPPADEEVEAFKEFLDSISADDFKAPGDS